MDNALPWVRLPSMAHWRDLVLPKEHGSWSLALEPLAFGLIAAPSAPGGWFAVAVTAAFLGRRPLRIAWREVRPERRGEARLALAACGLVATAALAAAISLGGVAWLAWLVPSALAGALFLSFDLRNSGREETAEIAGAAAFAFLPAAIATLNGAAPVEALALALVMCGRAVPTVFGVRALLRGAKTGTRRAAPALFAAFLAFGTGAALVRAGFAPTTAVVALGVLAARAFGLHVFPRPTFRARTIGMIEAALGLGFVLAVAVAWRF